ncbi:MAG: acyl carrier protein [Lachnospiraceae bacterium]
MDILEMIIENVSEITGRPVEELNENTSFEELGMKSIEISQIGTALEDEFDMEIPFMQFQRQKSFAAAAEYVESLLED